ncbi:MAG: chalcone isomerase family protein [Gammaproteobacteria bacterium]|nr:MAG: chalcone isomerase family protein [Gammaproteobacteria bacterium]
MYRTVGILLSVLVFTSMPAFAYRIADVDIPDSIQLVDSDTTLVLNGAGIREKLFMDIYIGALYLPAKTTDATAILNDTQPASVLMHFLYSKVSKSKITDGWQEGMKANTTAAEMETLKPDLDKFNDLFLTMHEGDVVRIDYLPGTGTVVRINEEWRGTIAGETFFRTLLRTWLGSSPVSKKLKAAMLGTN